MTAQKFVNSGEKSFVVIEEDGVEIQENPTLIFGFAGVGLIGPECGYISLEEYVCDSCCKEE
ncbi:MAG: hypothetical protein GF311_17020 [Candidatus Lokiarchaeota archaeon]|nr:hypothetical protein [Candidatus Lokiarchaeota archaeon]